MKLDEYKQALSKIVSEPDTAAATISDLVDALEEDLTIVEGAAQMIADKDAIIEEKQKNIDSLSKTILSIRLNSLSGDTPKKEEEDEPKEVTIDDELDRILEEKFGEKE